MNDEREYYAFTWPGKREAMLEAGRPTDKVLRPCVSESVNFGTTENLYIEGDNLEVLKVLQRSYMRKVKMIYIDPPYNTGHDFIYSDTFRQSESESREAFGLFGDEDGARNFTMRNYRENTRANPRYHSDWCSMIYPRLKAASTLLSDDGVIFVSIDDNEVANLRKICDEIFGEDNFRNQIIIRRGAKSVQAQFDTWDKLGNDFEYIMFYTKNQTYRFPKQLRPIDQPKAGSWNNHWRGTDRPTMRYELFGITPPSGQWRWSENRSCIAIENYKRMLSELSTDTPTQEEIDEWYIRQEDAPDLLRLSAQGTPEHYIPPTATTLLNSSWMDLVIGSSSEINTLFGVKVFDTPKLIAPIKRMLAFTDPDSIILDFFAGSSTTAHAVMSLNASDGGRRKFIMIQLPEPCPPDSEAAKAGYSTIAEIGRERIRRAGQNLTGDTGFRALRLDTPNFRDVFTLPEELTQDMLDSFTDNIKPERSDLDLLFQAAADLGLPLSLPYRAEKVSGFTVHIYGTNELAACFGEDITEEVIRYIAGLKPSQAVFRDSCFDGVCSRINLEQIFRYYAPESDIRIL
ncbi:MAG: site-specific DNA-methyltransferase [Synergistaceae bacterium]|nr:site-specific DNA-methyltransferase [Synergistaceae bacterium]